MTERGGHEEDLEGLPWGRKPLTTSAVIKTLFWREAADKRGPPLKDLTPQTSCRPPRLG